MTSVQNRAERDRWDTTVDAECGQLKLNTRKGDDEIQVSRGEDGRYRVRINGVDDKYFTAEEMSRLTINGGKGNDRLLLDPSAQGLNIRTKNIEEVGVLPDQFQPGQNNYPQAPMIPNGYDPWANIWSHLGTVQQWPNLGNVGYDQMNPSFADYFFQQGVMHGYNMGFANGDRWSNWNNQGSSWWI